MGKAPRKQLATKSARRVAQPASQRQAAVIDRMRARIQEETERFVGRIQTRIQDETIQFIRCIETISRCFLHEFQLQSPAESSSDDVQSVSSDSSRDNNGNDDNGDQATSPGVAVGRQ